MAVLKDLIVHGPSRFLNAAYYNKINADEIEADKGKFNRLLVEDVTATNATVLGLMDVKGELHTNTWTNSNIATIDGSFYITPTIGLPDGGTASVSANSISFAGTGYSLDTIYTNEATSSTTSSVSWTVGSKILVTGEVEVNGEWMPFGTLTGLLGAASSTSVTVNTLKANRPATVSSNPETLAAIISAATEAGIATSSLPYRNVKISMYQTNRSNNGTTYYPLGIYMSALGANGRTFIDIYGGNNAVSATYASAMALPVVRVGNLSSMNLPQVGGVTPNGWGIYTSNGFFSGTVAAKQGKIGSGTAIWTIGSDGNNRSYIYSGITNITTTGSTAGIYVGTNGISNYASTTQYVNLTGGKITAQGADITGKITASSGSIGGWNIGTDTNKSLYYGNQTPGATTTNLVLSPTSATNSNAIGGSGTGLSWFLSAGKVFGVTTAGALYSTSGKIGSWNIDSNNLSIGTWGSDNSAMLCTGTSSAKSIGGSSSINGWVFTAGSKFGVTKTGALYCNDIYANGGTIGGCSITNGVLQIANANITGGITIGKLDTSTQNKINTASENAEIALHQSIETIIGTQTAATGSWTGTSTSISALYDGLTIAYWLPFAGSGNATLNLTLSGGGTTGAKNCYYGGATRLTTHFGAGNIIYLTYRSSVTIGSSTYEGWWANANYNSHTNYTQYGNYLTAGTNGIRGYSLVMESGTNTWSCFYSDAYKGTAATKTIYTGGFKLGKILYTTGAGAQTNNSSLDTYYNYKSGVDAGTPYDSYPVDFRYSVNLIQTSNQLTTNKPVYLLGTIGNNGLFYLDTNQCWTQTIPTSVDNKTYIYLGIAYSWYQVWLSVENDAYQYYENKFRKLSEIEEMKAAKTATTYITDIDTKKGITIKPSDSSGNDYLQMNSSAIEFYRGAGTNNAAVSVMSLSDTTFRMGLASSNHTTIDSNGLNIYKGAEATAANKIATFGASIIFYDGSGTADSNKAMTIGANGISIKKGEISLGNGNFVVTSAGQLTAKSGYIGNGSSGFTIGTSSIYNGISSVDATSGEGIYLGTNGINLGGGNFVVTKAGSLTSNDGNIGGWSIGAGYLYASREQDGSTVYTLLKKGGDVAIATSAPTVGNTTGSTLQIFHDGRINAGYEPESGTYDMRITSGGRSFYRSMDVEATDKTHIPIAAIGSGGAYFGVAPITQINNITYSIRIKNDRIYGYGDLILQSNDSNSIYLNSYSLYRGEYSFLNAGNATGSYLTCFGNNDSITRVATKTTSKTDTGTSFMIANGYYAIGSASDHTINYNNAAVYISGGTDSTDRWLCMPPVYNRTYGYAANVYVTGNGVLGRSTSSSRRYKHDIQDVTDEAMNVLNVPVRTFKYNEGYVTGEPDFDYDKPITGFIAEEVAEICPACATYTDEDNKEKVPESWNEREFIPRMLYVIQQQQKEIKQLREEVNRIKNSYNI